MPFKFALQLLVFAAAAVSFSSVGATKVKLSLCVTAWLHIITLSHSNVYLSHFDACKLTTTSDFIHRQSTSVVLFLVFLCFLFFFLQVCLGVSDCGARHPRSSLMSTAISRGWIVRRSGCILPLLEL